MLRKYKYNNENYHQVYSSKIEKTNKIILNERLNIQGYFSVAKNIRYLIHKKNQNKIILDFSNLKLVYPNGIIPLIAEIDKTFFKNSVKFKYISPKDTGTFHYLKRMGWWNELSDYTDDIITKNQELSNSSIKKFDKNSLDDIVTEIVKQCAKNVEFAANCLTAFEWTINELADNVINHADSEYGWIQVVEDHSNNTLDIIVCDNGIGITRSLKQAYPHIANDKIALHEAIKKGITGNSEKGQGNGLAGSLAIAQANHGLFSINSGLAHILYMNDHMDSGFEPNNTKYYGTLVEFKFSTSKEINLEEALFGMMPCSCFENIYDYDENDALQFIMRDNALNLGTRHTGENIRKMLINFINANLSKSICIDMEGIDFISSSCADELFGKLISKMGITCFILRFKIKNLNPLCRAIIDKSIVQRLIQDYSMDNMNIVKSIHNISERKKRPAHTMTCVDRS